MMATIAVSCREPDDYATTEATRMETEHELEGAGR